MSRKILNSLLAVLMVLFIFGCGSDSDDKSTSDSTVASFGDDSYYVPNGVEIESEESNVIKLSTGEDDALAGAVYYEELESSSSSAIPRAISKSQTLNDMNTFMSSYNFSHPIESVQTLTTQVYTTPFEFSQGEYTLTSYSGTTSQYIRDLLLDVAMGTENAQEPTVDSSTPTYTKFNVVVAVGIKDSKKYYMFSVFPNSSYKKYRAIANSIANGTNIVSTQSTVKTTTSNFVGQAQRNSADFLFVIDDSGSMSNDQQAISQAADDFGTAITNSGIGNYNIAIITTDSNIEDANCTSTSYYSGCAGRVVNTHGIFTDIEDFKTYVLVGDSGSGTETGIYNSEQALSIGGILNTRGFPTNPLSVIILSDESSQYTSRGDNTFDTSDNIFIDNNYVVYPIVDSYYDGQYSDLAYATGGTTGDISATDQFPQIMETIAINAGGAASVFTLEAIESDENAYVARIDSVKVNGATIPESSDNGYAYNISGNKINFYGDSIPNEGDSIVVEYTYVTTTSS